MTENAKQMLLAHDQIVELLSPALQESFDNGPLSELEFVSQVQAICHALMSIAGGMIGHLDIYYEDRNGVSASESILPMILDILEENIRSAGNNARAVRDDEDPLEVLISYYEHGLN